MENESENKEYSPNTSENPPRKKKVEHYGLPKTNPQIRSAKSPPAMELAVEDEADE
jgi:hypothetical protein